TERRVPCSACAVLARERTAPILREPPPLPGRVSGAARYPRRPRTIPPPRSGRLLPTSGDPGRRASRPCPLRHPVKTEARASPPDGRSPPPYDRDLWQGPRG